MSLDEKPLTIERPEPPPSRRPGRKALLLGVAGACALGLAFGLMARPQLITDGPPREPMQASAKTAERQMDIVMGEAPPPPPLPERPPLETMSPETVAATAPPPEPFREEPRLVPREPPEPPQAPWAPEAPIAREPPRAGAPPSFDCRQAGSLAEEMICTDAVLAAADRHMARAFQRAVRSGAPYEQLRAEQNDWLAMREDAALRSPRALAALYDQRIAELNAIAEGPGPDW